MAERGLTGAVAGQSYCFQPLPQQMVQRLVDRMGPRHPFDQLAKWEQGQE